jgi:TolA-binding protein
MKPCLRLETYLNQQLSPDERSAFESHVQTCPNCARVMANWQQVRAVVRSEAIQTQVAAPTSQRIAQLVERVVTRAQPADVGRTARFRWVWAAGVAVALGAALFVAVQQEQRVTSRTVTDRDPGSRGSPLLSVRTYLSDGRESSQMNLPRNSLVQAPANGSAVVQLGDDQIGLKGESHGRVLVFSSGLTRVVLERGTMVCRVAPKPKGARFEVQTGPYRVSVVGTEFLVRVGPDRRVEVRVTKGIVEVVDQDRRQWRLEAHQQFESSNDSSDVSVRPIAPEDMAQTNRLIEQVMPGLRAPLAAPLARAEPAGDAEEREIEGGVKNEPRSGRDSNGRSEISAGKPCSLKTPPRPMTSTPVAPPDGGGDSSDEVQDPLTLWRGWVIEGRTGDAAQALSAYVQRHPESAEAWSLLADCRRKQGYWPEALDAYARVIDLGPAPRANRARFLSGVVLQDKLRDHQRAALMFEAYLQSVGQEAGLSSEAKVRLAQSLDALGQTRRAKFLLQEVIEQSDRPSVVNRAKKLLDTL